VSEGGLAEPRRAVEEQVVQRLVTLLCGVDGDAEVVLQLRLADELVETPRAQRDVDLFFVVLRLAGDDALSGQDAGSWTSDLISLHGRIRGARVDQASTF